MTGIECDQKGLREVQPWRGRRGDVATERAGDAGWPCLQEPQALLALQLLAVCQAERWHDFLQEPVLMAFQKQVQQ